MKALSFIIAASALLFSASAVEMTAAPLADTLTTASGLKYIIVHRGEGKKPEKGNYVLVHYTGRLTDGTVFDDSRKRKEPIAFRLGMSEVIRGWDEGIALLNVGDRATLIIPSDLGYGAKGAGGGVIPPNATLIFDVELTDIKEKSVIGAVREALDAKGISEAVKTFNRLKAKNFEGYYMTETQLNMLGYQLLKEERLDDAVAIFTLNAETYPESANVYDSLGEACLKNGDMKLAKQNYRKSLELDPSNKNAEEMLKTIK